MLKSKNPCGFVTETFKNGITNPWGFFYFSNFYLIKLISEPLTLRPLSCSRLRSNEKCLVDQLLLGQNLLKNVFKGVPVHSSSLCSAVSAAAISCFFSAAVYYRPKNEAKIPCFGKYVRIQESMCDAQCCYQAESNSGNRFWCCCCCCWGDLFQIFIVVIVSSFSLH